MPVYHVTNEYNEANSDRTSRVGPWVSENCPSFLGKIGMNLKSIYKFQNIDDANKWINYSLNQMEPPAASSKITTIEE